MSDDDILRDLAAEVGPATELRAEAEAAEVDAQVARLRKRSLADAVTELAGGRRIAVDVHGEHWEGSLAAAVGDLLVLHAPARRDVRLTPHVTVRALREPADPVEPVAERSFVARLHALALEEADVFVDTTSRGQVRGVITVVAEDHVLLDSLDHHEVIGLDAILAVQASMRW